MFLLAASLLNVELRSEGCDDPGKTGGCGTAFITVNNQDYSLHKRGLNVAVFTEQGKRLRWSNFRLSVKIISELLLFCFTMPVIGLKIWCSPLKQLEVKP